MQRLQDTSNHRERVENGCLLEIFQPVLLPIAKQKQWLDRMNHGELYVDKSMIIKDILDQQNRIILITRPRNWGKSMNINMLRTFLECPLHHITGKRNQSQLQQRQKHFKTLQISKDKNFKFQQHFGKYIVMHLDFSFKAKSSDNAILLIIQKVILFLEEHAYLRTRENSRYEQLYNQLKNYNPSTHTDAYLDMLKELQYLFEGQKIILLIDEYDYNYSNGLQRLSKCKNKQQELEAQVEQQKDSVIVFITTLFKMCHRTIVTGVRDLFITTSLPLPDIISDSMHRPVLKFDKYFGFTQEEIRQGILKKMYKNEEAEHKAAIQKMLNIIKKLYNGYKSGETTLYNPFSVIHYLQMCNKSSPPRICEQNEGQNLHFWSQAGPSIESILYFIKKLKTEEVPKLFGHLMSMIEQKQQKACISLEQVQKKIQKIIFKDLDNVFQAIYNLLVVGYFAVEDNRLKIPNEENKKFLQRMIIRGIKMKIQQYCKASQRENYAQPGIMFFPNGKDKSKPHRFIIQENKVVTTTRLRLESDTKTKIQEALHQIFKKNYFKRALTYNNWSDILVRAVVAVCVSDQIKTFQIRHSDHPFTREEVQIIVKYWEMHVSSDPNLDQEDFKNLQARYPERNTIQLLRHVIKKERKNLQQARGQRGVDQNLLKRLMGLRIQKCIQDYCQKKAQQQKDKQFNRDVKKFKKDYKNIIDRMHGLNSLSESALRQQFGVLYADIINFLIETVENEIRPQRQSINK